MIWSLLDHTAKLYSLYFSKVSLGTSNQILQTFSFQSLGEGAQHSRSLEGIQLVTSGYQIRSSRVVCFFLSSYHLCIYESQQHLVLVQYFFSGLQKKYPCSLELKKILYFTPGIELSCISFLLY